MSMIRPVQSQSQCVRNLGIYCTQMQTWWCGQSRCFAALYVNYMTDPSTSTEGHSSYAGSRTGSPLTAWLRQQCVNRHTSLPHTPIAVSTACGCKAHLQAEVFWPHHWCIGTCMSPLAADTRAHRVQDRSVDLQSPESCGTTISGTICPCRRPAWPTGFAFCSHKSSDSTSC